MAKPSGEHGDRWKSYGLNSYWVMTNIAIELLEDDYPIENGDSGN